MARVLRILFDFLLCSIDSVSLPFRVSLWSLEYGYLFASARAGYPRFVSMRTTIPGFSEGQPMVSLSLLVQF